jgi:hypothetical protein
MKSITTVVLAGWLAASATAFAQHQHLNAGASGTNQNDQLYFVNGDCCFSTNTGFALNLIYTNAGAAAGYYRSGGITMTSLPQTLNNGGPAFGAAAFGSYIVAELSSVSGPTGGVFSVWEANATTPTYSLASGSTGGTNRWNLSEGNGSPGSDPYGHIHGRVFTATMSGLYTVGFKLYDISTNGVAGSPIHTPSNVFYMNFHAVFDPRAVPQLSNLVANANRFLFTIQTLSNKMYQVEYKDDLSATNWTALGSSFTGSGGAMIATNNATGSQGFFRVKLTL